MAPCFCPGLPRQACLHLALLRASRWQRCNLLNLTDRLSNTAEVSTIEETLQALNTAAEESPALIRRWILLSRPNKTRHRRLTYSVCALVTLEQWLSGVVNCGVGTIMSTEALPPRHIGICKQESPLVCRAQLVIAGTAGQAPPPCAWLPSQVALKRTPLHMLSGK